MIDRDERRTSWRWAALAPLFGRPLLRLAVVGALVVAAFLLGRASHPPVALEHRHPPSTEAGAQGAHEPRWYTCSMHPQVRSLDPKEKCPLCGMDLIPVPGEGSQDGDATSARLTLSPRSAALLQVATVPVARRQVRTSLPLYGTVEVDETRLAHVTAWVAGRLERLWVDQTGVPVRAGEPMAEVYAPALVAAQQELLTSLAALAALPATAAPSHRSGAAALVAAAQDKLRLLGLSADQVDEVVRRGTVADRVILVAPVGGIVLERMATAGMTVEVGERLYTVADLSQVWVQLQVHEREVAWVRRGQPVSVRVAAHPGEAWRGTVAFVSPVVEEATRTVRVRVHLPNPGGRLKPGMWVTGEVNPPVGEGEELVIPATAALLTGRRAVVYVQLPGQEEPTFEAREVVLGPRVGEEVVVRQGLAAGELVVVRGNFKIDSELQIRGRPSMMAGEGLAGGEETPAGASSPSPAAPSAGEAAPPLAAATAALVRGNFALVKALSDDDGSAAQAAARHLLAELAGVEAAALPTAAAELWKPLSARMGSALERFLQSRELDDMRPHFESFSDALTEVVRRFGSGGQVVYRAVCPMVRGRKGYWLQPERTITNPYHGARMYSCGEVVETLTPPGGRDGGGGQP